MSDSPSLDDEQGTASTRSTGSFVGWAALLLVLGGLGGWALHSLLTPATSVPASADYTLVEARQGSVGHTIRLNARAEWSGGATILANAAGTVTEISVGDGDLVTSGDRVATIDLNPVVIADGATPAFRDMKAGDTGPDIAQLQRMLAGAGHDLEDSGTFDAVTERAVRQWQTDKAMPATGRVPLGVLVFAPKLPARVLPDAEVAVGSHIAPGQPLLRVLPEKPHFIISLPAGQAQLVVEGQSVTIDSEAGAWSAHIGPVELSLANNEYSTELRPEVGKHTICGSDCEILPVREPTLVPAQIQVVPEVDGIVIPASSVVTTADDQTAVVLRNGELTGVRVVAGSYGSVVVEGLAEGEQVRAPGLLPTDLDVRHSGANGTPPSSTR